MQARVWYHHKEYIGEFKRTLFDQEEYFADSIFRPTLGGRYTIMFEFFLPELNEVAILPIHHIEFISEEPEPEDDLNAKILEPIKVIKERRRYKDD